MYSRIKQFKTLKGVDESLDLMYNSLESVRLGTQVVPTVASLNDFCASDVFSNFDVPCFDRSAVDGYAVISSDVVSSSVTNPTRLDIIQEVFANSRPNELKPNSYGEASVVYTGAPIPPGADAVVMVEDTKVEGSEVMVYRPVSPQQNVSKKGEDFRVGDIVLKKRTLIKPWHIAALLSTGNKNVCVYKKLRIGVLSTGSELKEYSSDSDNLIVDTTRPLILSLIKENFCEAVDLGIVSDDLGKIAFSIKEALREVDMVITTGGTSVGSSDFVKEAILSLENSSVIFHGVRMRPGRPTGLALVKGKPVFMLSGYPVAAFTGFEVFVKRALDHIRGATSSPPPTMPAILSRRLAKPVGVKAFVRVKVSKGADGVFIAEPLRLTGSGLLSTLTNGDGLVVVDEDLEGYDEGDKVNVLLLKPV